MIEPSSKHTCILISPQALEVYQEVVTDLLADPGPPLTNTSGVPPIHARTFSSSSRDSEPIQPGVPRLQVREDLTHGVYVEGLGEYCVDNGEWRGVSF